MEITLRTRKMKSALEAMKKVVAKKQRFPILERVAFRVKDDKLTMIGTDLECYCQFTFDRVGEINRDFSLNFKSFESIVKNIKENEFKIVVGDGYCDIIADGVSYKIYDVQDCDEFPLTPDFDLDKCRIFSVGDEYYQKLKSLERYATKKKETREVLEYIYHTSNFMVATNGHFMKIDYIDIDFSDFLLHRQTVPILDKMRLPNLAVGDKCVVYYANDVEVIIPLRNDLKFPDYQNVIPRNFKYSFSLGEIKEKLLKVKIITDNSIKFDFSRKVVKNTDFVFDAPDLPNIEFNIYFKLDYIKTILEDFKNPVIRFNAEREVAVVSDGDYKSIVAVMPMKPLSY